MNCMKCGREIPLGQVFCKDCLADMEQYPVRPDTPVILPQFEDVSPVRKAQPQKKTPKPEDQVKNLRNAVVLLSLALVTAAFVLAMTLFLLRDAKQNRPQEPLPGQNYSTMGET